MMSKKEVIDSHFESATREYNLIVKICEQTIELFKKYGQPSFDLQQSRYNPQSVEDYIPGFPGSLFDAVWQISITMESIHAAYTNFATCFKNEEFAALKEILEKRQKNKSISDMRVNTSEDIDKQLVTTTFTYHTQLLDAANKINDYVSKSIAQKTSKSSMKRTLTNLWQSYSKCLGDFLPAREALKVSTDEMESATSRHINSINESEVQAKSELCQRVFKPYLEKVGVLVQSIQVTSNKLNELCSKIDFDSDFNSFTKSANFHFVDIEVPHFERFKFSSRFTMPDRIYIPRFKFLYFPLQAAVAKANFRPESASELPLEKGRRIYLMEQMESGKDWILALLCGWGKIGFVPSSFVEVIGSKLGVLKASYKDPNFAVNNERFVAVVKENEEDATYECIDESNVVAKVPKSEMYLL
ncbi:hypothetical protein GPJ56_001943 [Histomonas meleagridis]|uniref:uncharacterized protein n=1 Tax=Histomonas meleagridis TaxID=135588 RepID=UPI003559EFFD|nr:hypothetical protein GPJ56_001943 [Histomonas meleagridis]KAH0800981.1 hypothetical protein GO595_006297 [Histomonas meleagridis]